MIVYVLIALPILFTVTAVWAHRREAHWRRLERALRRKLDGLTYRSDEHKATERDWRNATDRREEASNLFFASAIAAFVLLVVCFVGVGGNWVRHASDLATIQHQQQRITVYEDRVERLQASLNAAALPAKPMMSLDADSPWATMYAALNEAESELATAHDARARAIISVETRRNGPMSGIITLVGDYR